MTNILNKINFNQKINQDLILKWDMKNSLKNNNKIEN